MWRIAIPLARLLLAGEQSPEAIELRAASMFGRDWRWLHSLARRYLEAFAGSTPRRRDVARFLLRDRPFAAAWRRHRDKLAVVQHIMQSQRMRPAAAADAWNVPPIETLADLADWLCLSPAELDWYADLEDRNRRHPMDQIRHYRYRVVAKRSGDPRLIEAPKSNMKAIQRRILADILNAIPSHPAAHGFVRGRSIQTFAAPHAGQPMVLRMDLREFFPSIAGARVQSLFRTAGYPEPVADALGGLCTATTPRAILRTLGAGPADRPHLPQGAPTSPAIANACAYRMDCRLTGLARAAGAVYTRYADDLAFSGGEEFARRVQRYAAHVAAIAAEEGFAVNHRKTRVLSQANRQCLAGIVVNAHPNIARGEYDRLKATLANCVLHGPHSQNREGHPAFREHLLGRVAFVESVNTARGARLRAAYERIVW
ncbi:MAG: reverse transcriptase family protein [Bryobacteraceae bacterium]